MLGKMLAKDADDRFATPREVAERLAPLAEGADLATLVASLREREESDAGGASAPDHTMRGTDEYLTSSMTETHFRGEDAESAGTDDESAMTEPSLEQDAQSQLLTQDSSIEDGEEVALARRGSPDPAEPQTEGLQTAGRPPVAAVPRSGDRGTTSATSVAEEAPEAELRPASLPQPARWYRRPAVLVATVALGIVGILAAAFVIRLQTSDGEIVITCSDPSVQVTVKRIGDKADDREFTLKQGDNTYSLETGGYEIILAGAHADEFHVTEGRTFTLSRNNRPVVKIERKPIITAVAESEDWPLGPSKNVLPGLIPRPAKLSGIGRWQAETIAPRSSVESLAYSPDGRLLACGSGHLRVYEVATGKLARLLIGHRENVLTIAWSPDGTKIATGSSDNTLRIWDVNAGKVDLTLEEVGGDGWVHSVAWSPDGKRITAVTANAVQVWNLHDGSRVLLKLAPTGNFSSVAWSPDGRWLATAGTDKSVRLWNADDGEPGTVCEGHTDEVTCVSFSPDGKHVASGDMSGDPTVRLWESATGEATHVLKGHKGHVVDVAWSPDGQRVASANDDGVRVWNTADGTSALKLKEDLDWVSSIAWSPDGSQLAIGTSDNGKDDNILSLWNTDDGELIREFEHHRSAIVRWSPDGRRLAAGCGDTTVRLLDAEDGKPYKVLVSLLTPVSYLCWSPDGGRIAAAGHAGDFRVLNAGDGTELPNQLVGRVPLFSPNGQEVAAWVAGGGEFRVWDIASDRIRRFPIGAAGTDTCRSLAWSPDGSRFASGHLDGTIRLTDAADGTPGPVLKEHSGWVRSVVWSPDGKSLASASDDGTVRIRSMEEALKNDSAVIWKQGGIGDLAWSPDGRWLAAGGFYDTTVRLWDIIASKPGPVFEGGLRGGALVDWSPTGNKIASGSRDHTIRVWDSATQETQWIAVLLSQGNAASFTPAGQLLQVDTAAETQLVYVVEDSDGTQELLTPAEFRKRTAKAAKSKPATLETKPPVPLGTWQPGSAEDVMLGLIPRPAQLPGIKRWQIETAAPRVSVASLDYSPDGSLVACGSEDGQVRLYDPDSGEVVQVFVGHKLPISSVCWSPDGKWLASGSGPATVRLWNATEGKPGRVLSEGGLSEVYGLAWSPDGGEIAVAYHGGRIQVWATSTGKKLLRIDADEFYFHDVAWSTDGKWIAVGCSDNMVRLWQADNGKPGPVLEGHTAEVTCVAFGPVGKRLASGGGLGDFSVRVWNLATGKTEQVLRGPHRESGHSKSVWDVAWSSDGGRVAATSTIDVVVWNSNSGVTELVLMGHTDGTETASTCVAWRQDGQQIATGDDAGSIRLWKTNDGELQRTLGGRTGALPAWSPDGKTIAVGSADMKLRLLNARDGKSERILDPLAVVDDKVGQHSHGISTVAWTPDSSQIVLGIINDDYRREDASRRTQRFFQFWNAADGSPGPSKQQASHQVTLSPDGRQIAWPDFGGISVWNSDTDKSELISTVAPIHALTWSPNGRWFAGVRDETEPTFGVWDARSGKPGPVFTSHTSLIYSLAFSPDSKRLASGSDDGTVRFWQIEAERQQAEPIVWNLKETVGVARSVAWSPDGQWVAAGGLFSTQVGLWNVEQGKPGTFFESPSIRSGGLVTWSPNSRQICAGSRDHTVRVFDVPSGETSWVGVFLTDHASASFSAAGQLLSGDPDVVEEELVYIVETDAGHLETLKPAEFLRRTANVSDEPNASVAK
ncbi:MAG: PD40 domain-containing protein [Planctomycetes bacterium]|nr:PD40 domain-containing protein [Planctomycetota bacterium]